MERTTLDWTMTNWITVFLMASFGALIIGAGLVTIRQLKAKVSA